MPGTYSGKTVPIKVSIGLRPNGHADHPNWDLLPLAAGGRPVDHMAGGWIYSKCGHEKSEPDSPIGHQFGLLFVSEQFADEASVTFPGIVTEITEQEAEEFIEAKCTAHLPDDETDAEALQCLVSERYLLAALGEDTTDIDTRIRRALDPDDPAPGKRRSKHKRYVAIKESRGLVISKRAQKRKK